MSYKPKVLFLSQILPYPLDSGPRIRTFFVLKHLAAKNDITLLAFIRSEKELENMGPLAEFCQVHPVLLKRSLVREAFLGLRSLFTGEPFMIIRHHSPKMAQLVRNLLASQDYDLIHVDQIKTAQFVADYKGLPKLIDKHNVYAHILRDIAQQKGNALVRLIARLEWQKMVRYEPEVCLKFDQLLAVTEQDKQDLDRMIKSSRPITVVPIASAPDTVPVTQRLPEARNILSVGSMFYPANVEGVLWFAQEIFPKVKAQVPEVKLFLVGNRPAPEIRQLADKEPSIVVTGYVEELDPYLEQSAVMIAPIRYGSGMRVKTLDALARGMPLVTTSFGCQGLEVSHNENILIADEAADFAELVIKAIQDRDFADRVAAGGRQFIEANLDWRLAYPTIDRVYSELLNQVKEIERVQ